MEYIIHSFRHAEFIVLKPEFVTEYNEILNALSEIEEDDIIQYHQNLGAVNIARTPKSISIAINHLIKQKLIQSHWSLESPIFQDDEYEDNRWRLDFAKGQFSVEVGFNHSGTVAWNLIKPVLASELNHVTKAIQTQIGIIITATQELKVAGGFDGAIGTYETYINYLKPLNNLLTIPLIIIGLRAPITFRIVHSQPEPRKTIGEVRYI